MAHAYAQPSPAHGRHRALNVDSPAEPRSGLGILFSTEPRQLCPTGRKRLYACSRTAWNGDKLLRGTAERETKTQVKSTRAFLVAYFINTGKKKDGKDMLLSLNGLLFLWRKTEYLNKLPDARSGNGSGGDLCAHRHLRHCPHPSPGVPTSGGRPREMGTTCENRTSWSP